MDREEGGVREQMERRVRWRWRGVRWRREGKKVTVRYEGSVIMSRCI